MYNSQFLRGTKDGDADGDDCVWIRDLHESDVHSYGVIKESMMKGSFAKVWAECGVPERECGPLGPLEPGGGPLAGGVALSRRKSLPT